MSTDAGNFSSEKQEFFKLLLNKKGINSQKTQVIPRKKVDTCQLSFAQHRLWFIAQLEPGNPFYNIPAAIRLQGELNHQALHESLNEILRRHEVLRTNFKTVAGQPIQVISSVTTVSFPVVDLSQLAGEQQQAQVRQLAQTEAQQPFNLETELMIRAKLLRLNQHQHVLLITFHHIACDGWSIGVFVSELSALYQAFCNRQVSPLAELPIQYADFAAWQRQWLTADVLNSQLAYWQKQLAGAPAVLELATDYPRLAVQTFRGANYSFQISPQLSVALQNFSQQRDCTLFMTLLAAFKTLLHRYSGSEDIVVGSPIANRNHAQIEELIGFFVNTLVLRTKLESNLTFEEFLTQVREVALEAYAHQDLPFELLVEKLQLERSLSHTPLFQVMFVLQNAPHSQLELPGLNWSVLESDSSTAKFDLTLFVEEVNCGLKATFEYNTDLFEVDTIERMAGHLQTLLSGIVANPQQQLWQLPLLTEAEKVQFLEWNNTEVEYPNSCIHQLFSAQVERTPDAVAVVFADQKLTYAQLNQRANQLAHYLQKLDVKPEMPIGIYVEPFFEMIVGLLGILKAGAAYLPLDPAYPQQRLAFMLSDAAVPVVLTRQQLIKRLPEHQARVVCLDTDWDTIAQESIENPFSNITADNLAYVIYTSGSTGKPKGVLGLHRGAVNRFYWMWQTYPFTQEEVCCQKTSLNFVDSVWEIFGPLLQGVQTVIVSDDVVKNPQQFVEALASNHVTRLVLVPSLLRVLLDIDSDLQKRLPKLKFWVTSGEALSLELSQKFRQIMPNSILLNLYGSSEVSADVTCYEMGTEDETLRVAIGRPINNMQVYVMDRNLQLVPVGVLGDLYVSGAGLARGYLNQPDLTAQRFISSLFEKAEGRRQEAEGSGEAGGELLTSNSLVSTLPILEDKIKRLYKTGDLVRYRADGNLEFLGRVDHQVKLRGFRIELGEIEAVLSQHQGVQETVVVAKTDEHSQQQLVAYVVPQAEQIITITELHRLLKEKLPEYMMPTAFVMLKALPLLPNGKVNYHALPILEGVRPELDQELQLPQTEIEQAIAEIWREVLHIQEIGIHDNFFELGGHSLLLIQVHHKLQQRFQQDFSLVEMFRYPTISHLRKVFNPEANPQISLGQNLRQFETRTVSMQRRKEVRQKHRTAKQKGESI
nr:amino acid adenylation domain-containing protein [Fischerella sp. JS2]